MSTTATDRRTQDIHIEWVQAGQPRPYADTYYEAIFTFSAVNPTMPTIGWTPPEQYVWKLVEAHMNHGNRVYKKDDPDREWHHIYADRFEKLPDGRWHVKLVRTYDD